MKKKDFSITIQKLGLICSLCLTLTSYSQNMDKLVDSIARFHFKDSTHIGLSIGYIKNDIEKEFYFGGKYTSANRDIDSTSLFEIGSVSKLYTSFLLAALEHEEKVSRFDKLSKYMPTLRHSGKKGFQKIRLVDLATHTAGLPGYDSTRKLEHFEGFDENNPYGIFTESFMLDRLKEMDSLEGYGEIVYSNFGVALLGYALATSQQTTFEELLYEHVLAPIGAKSTFYRVGEQQLTQIAIPHRGKEVVPLIQLEALSPSGAIKTTMPDLLKYLKFHLDPPQEYDSMIKGILANQLADTEKNMGLGWVPYEINGVPMFFHNGGTYGSSSIVILVPSKNAAVAILANNQLNGTLAAYALKLLDELLN